MLDKNPIFSNDQPHAVVWRNPLFQLNFKLNDMDIHPGFKIEIG